MPASLLACASLQCTPRQAFFGRAGTWLVGYRLACAVQHKARTWPSRHCHQLICQSVFWLCVGLLLVLFAVSVLGD